MQRPTTKNNYIILQRPLHVQNRSTADKHTHPSEIPVITIEEVTFALDNMKLGKAPGVDNVTTDLLKTAGKKIHQTFVVVLLGLLQYQINHLQELFARPNPRKEQNNNLNFK